VTDDASGEGLGTVTDDHHVRVSVVHGDLRNATYPVVVGHYAGDVIVNAEAALDVALGGRLRHRFDLGVYPGGEGTTEVIRNESGHPRGAIIVGLGAVGDLTPDRLRRVFATAASRYALIVAEDGVGPAGGAAYEARPWRSAALSSVLVGSYGGSSTGVADSILAILRGVIDANRQLARTGLRDRVRIDGLEFVELYEDMAINAAHLVQALLPRLREELEPGEKVEPCAEVVIRPGGRFLRPPDPYTTGWWRRFAVRRRIPPDAGARSPREADTAATLQFTTLSDRARLEQDISITQRALVGQLVAAATGRPDTPLDLSLALYELLVPPNVRDRIRQGGDLLFIVDPAGAACPFELFAQRTEGDPAPLATERGLLRQFETEHYRVAAVTARSEEVLLVADPSTFWTPLPGARREVQAVQTILEAQGLHPTTSYGETAVEIMPKLFAREYRILHFAAHGQYDPDPLRSGVVIGDRAFLTAAEVGALAAVPELVFLNCCHLGKPGEPRASGTDPRLAASLAEGFLRAGVRALIAAGWAVDDEAATVFAQTFYARLFGGDPFGEAVRAARQATHKARPTSNTWGAYQCYGNPDFRLRPASDEATPRPARAFAARTEALGFVRNLASAAGDASAAMAATVAAELARVAQAIPARWRDGEYLAAEGRVAAEFGDFEGAIQRYREAVAAHPARAPLEAAEQLANLLSRRAVALAWTRAEGAGPDTAEMIGEAVGWLDWIDRKLPPTRERWSLRGSVQKRWATLSGSGADRRAHLKRSARAYAEGARLAGGDAYERLNVLAVEYLLGRGRAAPLLPIARTYHEDACRKASAAGDRDFWDLVGEPDALLHLRLLDGTLATPAVLQGVKDAYRAVREAGPTARELASVRDHIVCLAMMLRDSSRQIDIDAARALAEIVAALE
jgi:hypothetical protein